jgi:hypothetical protein
MTELSATGFGMGMWFLGFLAGWCARRLAPEVKQ